MRVLIAFATFILLTAGVSAQQEQVEPIDATTLHGKIMCGYQGWFRCKEDASGMNCWAHWCRAEQVTAESLTVDMWPDVSEYAASELYPVPGFTHTDGSQAYLFSSDNADTVLRHFQWMQAYGIDGVWLQRFAVGLQGGPLQKNWYDSTLHVLNHVRYAAGETGRAWAISYDIAAMPPDDIYEVVTKDWEALVDSGVVFDRQYLHEGGKPVVQIWGFYPGDAHNHISAETGHRLVEYFTAPGPYNAYFVGGGTWTWRDNPDPEWQRLYKRFNAYCPWNIGNYSIDENGVKHAATHYWDADIEDCKQSGVFWIPVIYPGFSWDNLTRKAPGSTIIERRGGMFLWEQFHELAKRGIDTVYVAMFDEVDEGTAIFKVTSEPLVQGHFVGYEGLPSDWYLRLVGAGTEMLRGQRPITPDIPVNVE